MNLIAYGSLMHPAEFAALSPRAAVPVWVHGFRRAFDQRPMWRGGSDGAHTVLAVRPDAAARFNGILLIGIRTDSIAALDYRERGYLRTPVARDHLELFDGEELASSLREVSGVELYVGRSTQRSPTCVPLADYYSLCRGACTSWGERFALAFEQTTIGVDCV